MAVVSLSNCDVFTSLLPAARSNFFQTRRDMRLEFPLPSSVLYEQACCVCPTFANKNKELLEFLMGAGRCCSRRRRSCWNLCRELGERATTTLWAGYQSLGRAWSSWNAGASCTSSRQETEGAHGEFQRCLASHRSWRCRPYLQYLRRPAEGFTAFVGC